MKRKATVLKISCAGPDVELPGRIFDNVREATSVDQHKVFRSAMSISRFRGYKIVKDSVGYHTLADTSGVGESRYFFFYLKKGTLEPAIFMFPANHETRMTLNTISI